MQAYLIVEIFALCFWSFQLAPQAWDNWRHQSTEGLSSLMMLSWTVGSLATAIYNIGGHIGGPYSVLFIIQPNLFMVFSVICWAQTISDQYTNKVVGVASGVILMVVLLVTEVLASIYLLRSNDDNTPFIILASLSLVFFAIGFLPQYWQIYCAKKVEGISILFLMIDMTGSVLSIVSLALQDHFEPISGACYIVVFVFDLIIVMLHYLLPLMLNRHTPLSGQICNEYQIGIDAVL